MDTTASPHDSLRQALNRLLMFIVFSLLLGSYVWFHADSLLESWSSMKSSHSSSTHKEANNKLIEALGKGMYDVLLFLAAWFALICTIGGACRIYLCLRLGDPTYLLVSEEAEVDEDDNDDVDLEDGLHGVRMNAIATSEYHDGSDEE